MIIEHVVRTIVGQPPLGMEWLEYVIANGIFILLFAFVVQIFLSIMKMMR
jgi:hypothetical protein